MRQLLFFLILMFITTASTAQENFEGNSDFFVEIDYNLTKNYSHNFSVEQRVNWYDPDHFQFQMTQLDLAHFSAYQIDKEHTIALGVQYRLKETFDKNKEDELRITEEYKFSNQTKGAKLSHRFRAEQRFYTSSTSHRMRYKFGISLPLIKSDSPTVNFVAGMETLLAVAKNKNPTYQQRIETGVNFPLNQFAVWEIIVEYRMNDFTRHLGHELLIATGIQFSL